MSLTATFKNNKQQTNFSVGDRIKVIQSIKEGDKERQQVFEGLVIRIKGRDENKTFTLRRIGVQQVGIERIYSLNSPSINDIQLTRKGVRGVRRSKLYYIRGKSKREVEKIYSRNTKREYAKKQKAKETKKTKRKVSPKTTKRAGKKK